MTASFGEERMLIDGSLVRASTGALFDTVNPATEEVLGAAADASDDDAERALDAARRAFDTTTWSTDVAFRVRCLRQLQAAMRAHAEELRAMTIAETGSPLFMTRSAQLDDPVESLGWVADLAEDYEWTRDLGRAEPLGMRFGIASLSNAPVKVMNIAPGKPVTFTLPGPRIASRSA